MYKLSSGHLIDLFKRYRKHSRLIKKLLEAFHKFRIGDVLFTFNPGNRDDLNEEWTRYYTSNRSFPSSYRQ